MGMSGQGCVERKAIANAAPCHNGRFPAWGRRQKPNKSKAPVYAERLIRPELTDE
jgi:hypothetical protein